MNVVGGYAEVGASNTVFLVARRRTRIKETSGQTDCTEAPNTKGENYG